MMSGCVPQAGQVPWPVLGSSPGFRLVMGQPEQERGRERIAMSQDEELRSRIADDLDGSFEGLVRAYQDRLFSFALRVTGNREDAEEVAQDAFVRAYRALATYPAERIRALALRAWLYQVTLERRSQPAAREEAAARLARPPVLAAERDGLGGGGRSGSSPGRPVRGGPRAAPTSRRSSRGCPSGTARH